MKTKTCVSVLTAVLVGAAFAQSPGTVSKDNSDSRLVIIRTYLDAFRDRNLAPADNMPGSQPSMENRIVPVLAQELLSLHEEIIGLKKQIEVLKAQNQKSR